MTLHTPLFRSALAVIALTLTACATSPAPSYYTLSSLPPQTAAPAADTLSIALSLVTLPQAEDRAEMVVRTGPNRIELLDQHRWAESLRQNITRVIAEDLAQRLPGARVAAYAQYAARDTAWTVMVDIQRFESVRGEGVTIDAQWTLKHDKDGRTSSMRSVLQEPASDASYEALAAAHSRALARLSDQIALALRSRT